MYDECKGLMRKYSKYSVTKKKNICIKLNVIVIITIEYILNILDDGSKTYFR